MEVDRRTFLQRLGAFFAGAMGRKLLIGTGTAAAASTAAAATAAPVPAASVAIATAAGKYGWSVRQQVFEVIVRQGMAGAPWKEICAGPMRVNSITSEEVSDEIARRCALEDRKPQEPRSCEHLESD